MLRRDLHTSSTFENWKPLPFKSLIREVVVTNIWIRDRDNREFKIQFVYIYIMISIIIIIQDTAMCNFPNFPQLADRFS